MLKKRLEKLEIENAPGRQFAYSLWGIRRSINDIALMNKTDYSTELDVFLKEHGFKMRSDFREALAKELADIKEKKVIPQFPPFSLTTTEIEAEKWRLIGIAQARIEANKTTLEEEIEITTAFSYSTHPEVMCRVLSYLQRT